MFSLADIRRFKRMQKEYRKLSGLGDPREPETVKELWGASLHQYDDPNAFWGTLYKRNKELAKFVHKQALHYGNGKMTNAGFEKTIDEWGFAKLDVEDPRDLWLFGSLYGLGEVGGPLGELKTEREIEIRIVNLREEKEQEEREWGGREFWEESPRAVNLGGQIKALEWALDYPPYAGFVRTDKRELRTEREILLRYLHLKEENPQHHHHPSEWNPGVWDVDGQMESLEWVLGRPPSGGPSHDFEAWGPEYPRAYW